MLVNNIRSQVLQHLSNALAMSLTQVAFSATNFVSGSEKYEVVNLGECDMLTYDYTLRVVTSSYHNLTRPIQVASVLLQFNKTDLHFLATANSEGKVIIQPVTTNAKLIQRAMYGEFKHPSGMGGTAKPITIAQEKGSLDTTENNGYVLNGDKFEPVKPNVNLEKYMGL